MINTKKVMVYSAIMALIVNCSSIVLAQVEPINEPQNYISVGPALYDFEGDEEVKDATGLGFYVGHDLNSWWTLEGAFHILPKLDGNTVGVTELVTPNVPESGTNIYRRNRLLDSAGVSDTWALGVTADGLFHFTPWKRVDPYLTIGAGLVYYADAIDGDQNFDPALRGGGGVMYHYNDEWAVRADYKSLIVGRKNSEANSLIDVGVVWYWDANIPEKNIATGGPIDSDADGLTDDREKQIGTDPHNPDTDADGLKDGEEVDVYKTDPLNPDTDSDLLKDGEEVYKYETLPLIADTDEGGVIDGHEILEDETNPRIGHGADDHILFELNVQFEYDKAVIKGQYDRQLEVIGKMLSRHPEAKAKVEGHTDRFKTKGHISEPKHNKELSEKRAAAVVDYLVTKCKIDRKRLTSKGFGWERPKDAGKVDLVNGNPENRRTEIYISGAGKKADLEKEGLVLPPADEKNSKPENK